MGGIYAPSAFAIIVVLFVIYRSDSPVPIRFNRLNLLSEITIK